MYRMLIKCRTHTIIIIKTETVNSCLTIC